MEKIEQLLSQIDNKRLLIVFPHPDDESVMTAGLILKARSLGWKIKVICVSNGVMGQVHIHGQGKNVVQIRKAELARAMQILDVSDFHMWRFCDGLLKEISTWKQELKELVYSWKPGLVVTYGPCGVSGHPDHLVVGKEMLGLVKKLNNSTLLWPVFEPKIRSHIVNPAVLSRHLGPSYELSLSVSDVYTKWKAIKAHKSQRIGDNLPVPLLIAGFIHRYEHFAVANTKKEYDYSYIDFDLGD